MSNVAKNQLHYAQNRVAQPISITNGVLQLAIVAQSFDCAHCALCTQTLCFLLMYTTGLVRVDKQHTSKLHDNADARRVEYVFLELQFCQFYQSENAVTYAPTRLSLVGNGHYIEISRYHKQAPSTAFPTLACRGYLWDSMVYVYLNFILVLLTILIFPLPVPTSDHSGLKKQPSSLNLPQPTPGKSPHPEADNDIQVYTLMLDERTLQYLHMYVTIEHIHVLKTKYVSGVHTVGRKREYPSSKLIRDKV